MSYLSHIGRSRMFWFHLGAILTIVAWGISFVSTKVLLDNGLQPTEVYIYRTLLAYILVLAVCHKRILSNSLRDELLFVACGLCAGSLYFIAENTALNLTVFSAAIFLFFHSLSGAFGNNFMGQLTDLLSLIFLRTLYTGIYATTELTTNQKTNLFIITSLAIIFIPVILHKLLMILFHIPALNV